MAHFILAKLQFNPDTDNWISGYSFLHFFYPFLHLFSISYRKYHETALHSYRLSISKFM